jgi:NADPH:quinone reductase-like Zn-dependent oxidoreductase
VQRFQLDQADSIGAHETIALDDPAAFATIPQVDIVANMLRGQTATDLLAKVKPGGTFASVTGEPDGAKDYPRVRVVVVRLEARSRDYRLHRRRRKRRRADDPHRLP